MMPPLLTLFLDRASCREKIQKKTNISSHSAFKIWRRSQINLIFLTSNILIFLKQNQFMQSPLSRPASNYGSPRVSYTAASSPGNYQENLKSSFYQSSPMQASQISPPTQELDLVGEVRYLKSKISAMEATLSAQELAIKQLQNEIKLKKAVKSLTNDGSPTDNSSESLTHTTKKIQEALNRQKQEQLSFQQRYSEHKIDIEANIMKLSEQFKQVQSTVEYRVKQDFQRQYILDQIVQLNIELQSIKEMKLDEGHPKFRQIYDHFVKQSNTTYHVDSNGYLLDENNHYILDENNHIVKLTKEQMQKLLASFAA